MKGMNMRNRLNIVTLGIIPILFGCSESTTIGSRIESGEALDGRARPNILFVLADDLGFTDLGSFGSEIPTPNLDKLALAGLRFTNLHTAANCTPSRIMIFSGAGGDTAYQRDPRYIDEPSVRGVGGGVLGLNYASLAELLQDSGYKTYMTGKWDLGYMEGYSPGTRGFDRSFALLGMSASYFREPLQPTVLPFENDGQRIDIEDLPEDFYSTKYFTDKILDYLQSHEGDAPWFAYIPYNAVHWPLQVPDDWLDRHSGRYDGGYDLLRQERVTWAEKLGVIPEGATLANYKPLATPWNELSLEQQRRYSRAQEIYASVLEYMDMSIGRITDYLEETGQLDNTLVLFASDHGGSASESGVDPAASLRETVNRDNSFENFGRPMSYIDHGEGFAEAATAPFRDYKATLSEGGLRAASFISYPAAIPGGDVSHTFLSLMDILPTLLDIAKTEHPGAGEYKGRQINNVLGRSFWPYATGLAETVHEPTDTVAIFRQGAAAFYKNNYKIVNEVHPSMGMGTNIGSWRLYNIAMDPGEHHDLATEFPHLIDELTTELENNWR